MNFGSQNNNNNNNNDRNNFAHLYNFRDRDLTCLMLYSFVCLVICNEHSVLCLVYNT